MDSQLQYRVSWARLGIKLGVVFLALYSMSVIASWVAQAILLAVSAMVLFDVFTLFMMRRRVINMPA